MSEAFYEEKAAGALLALTKKGAAIRFYRLTTTGVFDPVKGGFTAGGKAAVSQTQELVGLTLPASKGTVQAFDDRIKEGLLSGKLRFFIFSALQPNGAPALFPPSAGDVLVFKGTRFTVMGMTRLSPVGVDVLYKLGCQEGSQAFTV